MAWLDALARQAYDLRADDARFRAAVLTADPDDRAAAFTALAGPTPGVTGPGSPFVARCRRGGEALTEGLGMGWTRET